MCFTIEVLIRKAVINNSWCQVHEIKHIASMEQINAQWMVASLVFKVSGSFAVGLQSTSAYPSKPRTGGCVVYAVLSQIKYRWPL